MGALWHLPRWEMETNAHGGGFHGPTVDEVTSETARGPPHGQHSPGQRPHATSRMRGPGRTHKQGEAAPTMGASLYEHTLNPWSSRDKKKNTKVGEGWGGEAVVLAKELNPLDLAELEPSCLSCLS